MKYFEQYFSDTKFDGDEVKIKCPFHNDTHPSASINTDKSLFHCFTCNLGLSEEQFIARVQNISLKDAMKYKEKLFSDEYSGWEIYVAELWSNPAFLECLDKWGITKDTIEETKLGLLVETKKEFLAVPVFFNNVLMDIRIINILKHPDIPKVRSKKDSEVGFVIPFDVWKNSSDTTYIFEGEKDMLIAREQGLNAITLTGGAGAKLNDFVLNSFTDKDVIICYDNDEAGRKGMQALFYQLKSVTKYVKYVDIGELVPNEKEDFYDYIMKYNGDIFTFLNLEQKEYEEGQEEINTTELTTIENALLENKTNIDIVSEVTIISEVNNSFIVPTLAKMTKGFTERKSSMIEGEERIWELDLSKPIQMLELIEEDAKKAMIYNKIKAFAKIPEKESNVELRVITTLPIYKATAIDRDTDGISTTLDLYSFEKLTVGNQYRIIYHISPHPTKQQRTVGIVSAAKSLSDLIKCTPDPILLNYFKNENLIDNLSNQFESMRHHVAPHMDFKIWLMTDLVFNSLLDIPYEEVMRGTLDVFFLGDTQVGKSETTSLMTTLYDFGHFLSLKTSTTIGLIGGSTKIDGSYCNTIGAIPRQHKRLIVLEEFSGAKDDFISTMTDLRSSNTLRLTRAAGELRVSCKVRMITISNPVNDNQGNPRFLTTFTNGVTPIMELIKAAEDVARYDAFLLIAKKDERYDPFKNKLKGTAIPVEAYRHHIQWTTSRTPENVEYAEGVKSYIWDKAQELNKLFECNFPLFGVTTPKKLARFAVALAALTVSTDENYEKVIVTEEIVDYVVNFLKVIYDNEIFRLKEYKAEYEAYSKVEKEDIDELARININNSVLLSYMYSHNRMSRASLKTVSGLEGDKFNMVFSKLIEKMFVKLEIETVYTSEKFRKAYARISREFTVDTGVMEVKGGDTNE